jgi:hypothetical protein
VESLLDFWLGRWRVVDRGGAPAGENLVESAVGGSVVLEHWSSVGGDEGKSLFFADPATGQWKQVWVQAGCVKKKLHDPAWTDGVRFVGTALVGDRRIPDRTTLTPLEGGRVLQIIEQSRDGRAWRPTFEALYERLDVERTPRVEARGLPNATSS